uniref:Terpene synthase n=1 Tax=Bionectria ochroleuca TaxID=29856 RepID=A0A8H7N677_BIOOC
MKLSRVFLGQKQLQLPRPRQLKIVNIPLKKHDICLQLQVPNVDLYPERSERMVLNSTHLKSANVSAVQKAHLELKTFEEQSRVEVGVIERFFPGYLADGVRICFAAWLAFICAVDDILECLSPSDGEAVLYRCIGMLRNNHKINTKGRAPDTEVERLTRLLYDHSRLHLPAGVCDVFFKAICEILKAHIAEFHFLDGQTTHDLSTYMSMRRRTIALDPFFEIIKYMHLPKSWRRKPTWKKLQEEVCSTAGLQNDLLGLEKDLENGDGLNSVLVLLRNEGWATLTTVTLKCLQSVFLWSSRCTMRVP